LNVFNSSSRKGEETRARIYTAALALFRERGFDAATMRDIAAAAGMSLGAAYHYFPSKDTIVLAYYDDVGAEHERRVRAELRELRSLRDRLRVPFHTKLDILQADRPLMGALIRFAGQPNHPLSFLGPATRSMQLQSMAIFAEALRGTKLPDDLRTLVPVILWAMHMGILLFFLYDQSPGQQRTRRLVDGSVDLFVVGLKLASVPVFRGFRRKVLAILSQAGLVPTTTDLARIDSGLLDPELAIASPDGKELS
jgi:AcrR family transcriptional regulator